MSDGDVLRCYRQYALLQPSCLSCRGGGWRIRRCQFCHPRPSKLNAVLCLRPERDDGHCHGHYDLDDGQAGSGSVVSGCRRGGRAGGTRGADGAGGTRGADGAGRRGCGVDHDLHAQGAVAGDSADEVVGARCEGEAVVSGGGLEQRGGQRAGRVGSSVYRVYTVPPLGVDEHCTIAHSITKASTLGPFASHHRSTSFMAPVPRSQFGQIETESRDHVRREQKLNHAQRNEEIKVIKG